VVTIRAAGTISVANPLLDLFRFPAQRRTFVPGEWVGSGVLIDREGHVVTTEHVVRSAQDVLVSLAEGTSTRAVIVGTSRRFDLALLRVDLNQSEAVSPALLGDSDDVMVGEWAIAIGSPFGDDLDPQPSVSVGVISAVNRDLLPPSEDVGEWPYFKLLQTDAAINRGNSGGPLVNTNGEVIGVNMALYGISANVGVNFSVPINTVKWVVEELRRYGEVRTPWVGWHLEERFSVEDRRRMGLAEDEGVLLVAHVEPESPAARAGIGVGNLVYKINDLDPYSRRRADRILFETRVGDSIRVQLFKDGQLVNAVLEVLENPKMKSERLRRSGSDAS
jgi:serine protease Do